MLFLPLLLLRFAVIRPSLLDDEEELELDVDEELEEDERDPEEEPLLSEELLLLETDPRRLESFVRVERLRSFSLD